MSTWHFGSAAEDTAERRGWFIGNFMPDGDVRCSSDVEVKWGSHPAGDEREAWHDDEARTTLLLLIEGRFRINLSVADHVLAHPGDYAMWGPGIGHSWRAEQDSIVVTVRWPSLG
jgi:hypothetical protein